MRMDGAAVLACKTRMYDIGAGGRNADDSAMGNLPTWKPTSSSTWIPFWSEDEVPSSRGCSRATSEPTETGREYHGSRRSG